MQDTIQNTISENKVVLFMKGTPQFPQCGFSARVSQILNYLMGESTYHTVDVLSDNNIREGIKQYSNWPTIPQLYVDNEFIGGCDIVNEMAVSGELKELLEQKNLLKEN